MDIFRRRSDRALPGIMDTPAPQWVVEHFHGYSAGLLSMHESETRLILSQQSLYRKRESPLWIERNSRALDWLVIDTRVKVAESGRRFVVARSLTTAETMRSLSTGGIIFPEIPTKIARHAASAALMYHPSTARSAEMDQPYADVKEYHGGSATKRATDPGDTLCYVVILQKDITESARPEYGGHRTIQWHISQIRDGKEYPLIFSTDEVLARDPHSRQIVPVLSASP